jgi:ABC-type Fe3+-hydroxamate transport system substrate-binding protein
MQDDLGHPFDRSGPATRVVSLVPSLTESVALSRPGAVVGATDWCTHPSELEVTRVRGTKNPDVCTILGLEPDVVLANREENRRSDVDALRAAGLHVWVTVIETLDQAFTSLRRMFAEALGWPAPTWIAEAESVWRLPAASVWRLPAGSVWRLPAESPHPTVVVPIWRDPWMVVGSSTFTGDLVERLGYVNAYGSSLRRYPKVDLAELVAADPDLVLLPDEPYRFTDADGPEAFPNTPVALVEGRSLTWYGPSLATARGVLAGQIASARIR